MSKEKNYLEINKNSWNQRTKVHLDSKFYDVPGFLKGKSSLKEIELKLLGDIKGKSILHLQCHFGQDSISMAKMGALVTGVDLSDLAIENAKKLAEQTNTLDKTEFICCDIYDLPSHLNKKFDLVFTSYGTIAWLPDLDKWAKIISQYLKPRGEFIFVEFHPVVWMFDNNFSKIEYSYFQTEAIVETEDTTYGDNKIELITENVTWNHSLGVIMTSLINNDLLIDSFAEYDYSPYDCFNETEEFEPGKFRIKHLENKIPMVFSLTAKKTSSLSGEFSKNA
jgi:2-polyprenyl-3-methyl-5-hydroxy-6-metoxy-1,4-benzoquinol methylase